MHFALVPGNHVPSQPPHPVSAEARRVQARVVERHLHGVWRFLRVLGCSHAEADDLAQEVFVVALGRLGDRSGADAASFLRRTARHLFLRSRAKERRRAELLAAAAERLWERRCADGTGDDALRALRRCVAELPPRSREIVRLAYGEGRSRAELARALGMRENGVKTALQRLRARLRECLERRLS